MSAAVSCLRCECGSHFAGQGVVDCLGGQTGVFEVENVCPSGINMLWSGDMLFSFWCIELR